MKTLHLLKLSAALLVSLAICPHALAQAAQPAPAAQPKADEVAALPLTVAILPFEERGEGVKDMGGSVGLLVFKGLSADPRICLVERAEIDKAVNEQGMGQSGVVNQEKAVAVGQVVGAKIIITGSVFKVAGKTNIVAKIIATETTRVIGCGVDGSEPIDILCQKLSAAVSENIAKKSANILPAPITVTDVVETLKTQLGDAKRLKVFVSCSERHIGHEAIDPAVETEFKKILADIGCDVLNADVDADVVIKGEGFSETTLRKGGLVCAKARVELNATAKGGTLICADRQVAIGIDAAEGIAGKQALQNAAAKLALRIIPKIVKK